MNPDERISDVTCGGCGRPMPATENAPREDRQSCPDCDSPARAIEVTAAASLTLRGSLNMKLRHAGSAKVVQEQFVGAAKSADGSWVEKATRQDREADRYLEHITGPDGSVLHHDEGPLSEHWGHGSDKSELRAPRDAAKQARAAERAARKARRDEERRNAPRLGVGGSARAVSDRSQERDRDGDG